MCEQHLGRLQLVLAQAAFIHLHQPHLANGGGSLQLVNLFGAGMPAQALHALGNRAAADHDDFTALLAQGGQLSAPLANGGGIQSAAFVSNQAGAHFHDDAAGLLQGALRQCGARRIGMLGGDVSRRSHGACVKKWGGCSRQKRCDGKRVMLPLCAVCVACWQGLSWGQPRSP